jgi:hypothetical protein
MSNGPLAAYISAMRRKVFPNRAILILIPALLAGVGSYTISIAPSHGNLSFYQRNAVVPGRPAGSPPLPALSTSYTWTVGLHGVSLHLLSTLNMVGLNNVLNLCYCL